MFKGSYVVPVGGRPLLLSVVMFRHSFCKLFFFFLLNQLGALFTSGAHDLLM